MGGALAVAFSSLLKKMWSGEPSSVKPDDLKVRFSHLTG